MSPSADPSPSLPKDTLPLSVVVLTLNEEQNIAECLRSCRNIADIHVLDSLSTDRTCDLARELGAQVHQNRFESFGRQRNWAIDNIPLRYDWVFHLDADERFTPALLDDLARLLAANPSEAGFYVPSKLMFMGRWLRRTGSFPTYQVRLFHKGRLRFRDYGHGQREETTGALGKLAEPYLHYNFSKGLTDWFEKHNKYSLAEAKQAMESLGEPLGLGQILGKDPIARRRALKRLWYRLPMRPTLRWLLMMFVQGGILEGRAGRTYARLMAMYERMTILKIQMLRAGHEPP